jgi:DNA polymerase alpha subunit A
MKLLTEMNVEFEQIRKSKNIPKWGIKFVTKKYAFEMPLQKGEYKFLKIKYPATLPSLPANLTGNKFECLFGCNQSMLERFILKQKIKGPCWLTIRDPV